MGNKSNHTQNKTDTLQNLKNDFYRLRDPQYGEKYIDDKLSKDESDTSRYLAPWYAFSKEASNVFPSQGLLMTPYDYLNYHTLQMLPQETLIKTLRLRMFFLEMFNHPYRMQFLKETTNSTFAPVPKIPCKALESALNSGLSLNVGDLGASVVGSHKERVSRNERYAKGPFVKLGRQARTLFVGSASPDVWNSAAAVATMAASHCLTGIPRNGVLNTVERQTAMAKEVFEWLEQLKKEILEGRPDKSFVYTQWKRNVSGTLEASPTKAVERAAALHEAGVTCFRVYSPEPGTGTVDTVKALRKEFGNDIEIFTGQIIDIEQAKRSEEAGADGLYIGVGGGGRCTTGVRSGSVIEWPGLLWQLRGEVSIPVIVEGGASDHVAVTLLLGGAAISVSRVVSGGTLESPGGALFCSDGNGKLFKPYGGEASARTKYLDGKLLPFGVPSFVEGETTKAEMSYVKHVLPTLTYNLHMLIEDSILAMVFRNVENIHQLHALAPSPLRQATSLDLYQRSTH